MTKKVRIAILLIIFLLSILVLSMLKYEDKKSQDTFSTLQEIASLPNATTTTDSGLSYDNTQNNTNEYSDSTAISKGLSDLSYAQLYDINNDFMGWLTIPNTNINYPVMQSDEENYYLNKDFYKKYSSYGVPYIDQRYEIDTSLNLLIYGHSMTNTTMFADVLKYNTYDYYTKNNIIEYTDKNGFSEYKIFSAFAIDTNDNFDYNNYINMSEDRYNEFVKNAITYSLYDTKTVPQFGDKLITLSTCENTNDSMRFVVVGMKI